jgi:hypothetical protein
VYAQHLQQAHQLLGQLHKLPGSAGGLIMPMTVCLCSAQLAVLHVSLKAVTAMTNAMMMHT